MSTDETASHAKQQRDSDFDRRSTEEKRPVLNFKSQIREKLRYRNRSPPVGGTPSALRPLMDDSQLPAQDFKTLTTQLSRHDQKPILTE
jgi:hypothetical protein